MSSASSAPTLVPLPPTSTLAPSLDYGYRYGRHYTSAGISTERGKRPRALERGAETEVVGVAVKRKLEARLALGMARGIGMGSARQGLEAKSGDVDPGMDADTNAGASGGHHEKASKATDQVTDASPPPPSYPPVTALGHAVSRKSGALPGARRLQQRIHTPLDIHHGDNNGGGGRGGAGSGSGGILKADKIHNSFDGVQKGDHHLEYCATKEGPKLVASATRVHKRDRVEGRGGMSFVDTAYESSSSEEGNNGKAKSEGDAESEGEAEGEAESEGEAEGEAESEGEAEGEAESEGEDEVKARGEFNGETKADELGVPFQATGANLVGITLAEADDLEEAGGEEEGEGEEQKGEEKEGVDGEAPGDVSGSGSDDATVGSIGPAVTTEVLVSKRREWLLKQTADTATHPTVPSDPPNPQKPQKPQKSQNDHKNADSSPQSLQLASPHTIMSMSSPFSPHLDTDDDSPYDSLERDSSIDAGSVDIRSQSRRLVKAIVRISATHSSPRPLSLPSVSQRASEALRTHPYSRDQPYSSLPATVAAVLVA